MYIRRIKSGIIDYPVMNIFYILIGYIIYFFQNYFFYKYPHILKIAIVLYLMLFILLFPLKDLLFGRSIGKKMCKLKIITKSGKQPNCLQLVLRNITFVIWPLEAILVLLKKDRIGDVIAKTKVVSE